MTKAASPGPTGTKKDRAHSAIEAAIAEEKAYRQWALNVINSGWHRECPSRRCRRNGCHQIDRCEPQQRLRLHQLLGELTLAELEPDHSDKPARRGSAAEARAALLAEARANGWLPLPDAP